MTDRFIDNFTPGSGGDGLSWANAELTAAAVDAVDAAGDRWLFDYRHSESTGAAITLSLAGTLASPSQLISVTQTGASGVSGVTAGATIATGAGSYPINISGVGYIFGITFTSGVGSGSNFAPIMCGADNDHLVFDTCTLYLATSNAAAKFRFGTGSVGVEVSAELLNTTLRFAATGQGLQLYQTKLVWRGGGLHASGAAITLLISSLADGSDVLIDGVDLSYGASGMNLCSGGLNTPGRLIFRNCKLPASWSGGVFSSAPSSLGIRGELYNCAAGDVNYAMWVEDYAGSIKHETTIVHTGGASDGTTPISWKMASSANAEYPAIVLRSPEIFVPNTTTGASKTLTVEIAQDGTTTALNDDEIWLEVEYLGTSGTPLALFASDAKADVIASAAAQANSSETWSGLSGTNKKQALSVTITPQEEGVYIARVCLAKASTTVYVDPKVTVS